MSYVEGCWSPSLVACLDGRQAKLTVENDSQDGKSAFWRRVVIEKPFGHSLDSARELTAAAGLRATLPSLPQLR